MPLDIFRFQYSNNLAYRTFCERSGRTPETVRVWGDIPPIVTSAFKDLDLTVLPAASRTITFHSSGTTLQRPSRHFHSAETLALYEESLLDWFQPHLLSDLPRAAFLILSPPPEQARHSSLAHMFRVVQERFGIGESRFLGTLSADGSWQIDFARLEEVFRELRDNNEPVVICGTAFSFIHWCDHLAGRGSRLFFPPGSRVFETGGYKARSRSIPKPELHRMIEERLGIPQIHIVSEYGMSELSSQAYDRVAGQVQPRAFRFPAWARAVIISPETQREVNDGETGLVRIYDLANVGSVLAIQTEDLATRRGEGFELIGRAALAEPRGCSLQQLSS